MARHLSERIGEHEVTAHHGSLSKETRLDAEHRLKTGALKALVATASLELGIDIGYVDLVCQIGSPHRIATFLQRVGRSGHTVLGTPKGRLMPASLDDLVECAALLRSVRQGDLDAGDVAGGSDGTGGVEVGPALALELSPSAMGEVPAAPRSPRTGSAPRRGRDLGARCPGRRPPERPGARWPTPWTRSHRRGRTAAAATR